MPSLAQLDTAVREFLMENPDDVVTVVVDASFGHRIDGSESKIFEEAEAAGELVSPPAGAIGRGDAFLLRIADKTGATVLSNDSFQEFHGDYDWLFERGRLIGGKPVPGVGWIFTPRTPVRGPRSREAVKEAKRKVTSQRGGDNVESAVPGLDLAAERSRGRGKGQKTVERAIAVALEEAVSPLDKRPRRRKSGSPPAEPVNDPLAFITFIAAHPLGAEVSATVDSFASHGAFVECEGARCYVPLSGMGDPPPKSAREIFTKGEVATFVIQALDPQRRGVELAVPGFAKIAGAPTEETVAAEIEGRGDESAPPTAPARGRGRGRGRAKVAALAEVEPGASDGASDGAAAAEPVAELAVGDGLALGVAPVKRSRKKAVAPVAPAVAPAEQAAAGEEPAAKRAPAKRAAAARAAAGEQVPARKRSSRTSATLSGEPAAVEPAAAPDEPIVASKSRRAPAKRPATVEPPAAVTEVPPEPGPARRGRRPSATTEQPSEPAPIAAPLPPVETVAPVKRGRAKKVAVPVEPVAAVKGGRARKVGVPVEPVAAVKDGRAKKVAVPVEPVAAVKGGRAKKVAVPVEPVVAVKGGRAKKVAVPVVAVKVGRAKKAPALAVPVEPVVAMKGGRAKKVATPAPPEPEPVMAPATRRKAPGTSARGRSRPVAPAAGGSPSS